MRAPLPDLDALDIEALKALILSQHQEKQRQLEELDRQRAALAQQRTQYQDELRERSEQIEHLRLVVEKLRRMLFGRKSEKLSIQLDQLVLQLEEMEAIHAALASAPVREGQTDNTGAKPARKPLPEHLPRQIVTHEPKEQCCPECGGDLRHFGEDVFRATGLCSGELQGDPACPPEVRLQQVRVCEADAYSGFHHLYDTGRFGSASA